MQEWFEGVKAEFDLNFIQGRRWRFLVNGLGNTLKITRRALVLGLLNAVCKVYLTVLRGTPVVVQLMIIYFVIFASSNNGVLVASLAFGLNSGAYVAEIIRGGIMSIDNGQFEAGRSLGFNYLQTMRHIIIPQVF